jgi:hypothetical protein
MNWFGKFILTVFVSFCCMIGALGAKFPVSILLVLLVKGCWLLFFGTGIRGGDGGKVLRILCGGGIGGGEAGGCRNQRELVWLFCLVRLVSVIVNLSYSLGSERLFLSRLNFLGFPDFCFGCPLRAGPFAVSFVPKGCHVCP